MRVQLLERLIEEYGTYKSKMLRYSRKEIFGRCYEIGMMEAIYKMVLWKLTDLSQETVSALLTRQNILGGLYDEWLKREDDFRAQIYEYVTEELKVITKERVVAAESDSSKRGYNDLKQESDGLKREWDGSKQESSSSKQGYDDSRQECNSLKLEEKKK